MKVHSSKSGGQNLLQKKHNYNFTTVNTASSMLCMCW